MCMKADDDVSDLDAGVVDVVLDFDPFAGGLENAHERVAQHRVANVTDVRGFVGIDAGVLDHLLRPIRDGGSVFELAGLSRSEQR